MMTNVGRARVTLGPGEVAVAGAASGVVTRAICQVAPPYWWNFVLTRVVFLASGRVQNPNAAPI